jgi:hypothetical protein
MNFPFAELLAGNRGRPLALISVGVALVAAGWLLPVQVHSLTPLLLSEAGRGTPGLIEFGRSLLETEKTGPAALVAEAGQALRLAGAEELAASVAAARARQPELVPWGGWDPYLEPFFSLPAPATVPTADGTPETLRGAAPLFIPERARRMLRETLTHSRSSGVQAILATSGIDRAERFVPATRAGGQPLDATILMAALLLQGNRFSPELGREVRVLAEEANAAGELAPIETFYFDLLVLARRLDWIQLGELLQLVPSTRVVGEFAHLARVAPEAWPVLYAAALQSRAPREVSRYALTYGKGGVAGLELALTQGEGALRQTLLRQVPVNPDSPLAVSGAASLSLRHPHLMTALKYLLFLGGVWFLFRGLDRAFIGPARERAGRALMHARSGVLALVFSAILFVLSEPFLLRGNPPPDYEVRVTIPALQVVGQIAPPVAARTASTIDGSTIISVLFFASLQVMVYLVCLLKIRQIEREQAPHLLKLRLMENEENLFDSGLYVGIGGTAAALVMQVIGIIEPNLLAAYSSNLFGITCVALVKILHVRPYKTRLILLAQQQLLEQGLAGSIPGNAAVSAPLPAPKPPARSDSSP